MYTNVYLLKFKIAHTIKRLDLVMSIIETDISRIRSSSALKKIERCAIRRLS